MVDPLLQHYSKLFDLLRYKTYLLDEKIRCAHFLKEWMDSIGLETGYFQYSMGDAPILVGKTTGTVKKRILIYSHYDVKPPGNLEKWLTDPFEPCIKDGRIYARGSGDAKGQLFIGLYAVEELFREMKQMENVGITLLIEGEEESGSPNLQRICQENKTLLESDLVLILDSHWYLDTPLIAYGTRGQISFYLEASEKNQKSDLHAGNYGGLYKGAVYKMVRALANTFDQEGKVTIPGFYDGIEPGFDIEECSVSICAIEGGDMDRSLIPYASRVHMDVRIIQGQKTKEMLNLLMSHFENYGISLIPRQASDAVLGISNEEQLNLLVHALEESTRIKPFVMPYLRATVPMDKLFPLEKPVYIVPFAQSDENNHAPNENIKIENMEAGILFIKKLIQTYR